jgi:hypothetical protein
VAASWPTTLPPPSPDGYSVTPGDGRHISNMSQGPVRVRRRYVTVHDTVNLTLDLVGTEMDDWLNLWFITLQGGVLPVNMPLMEGSSVVNKDVIILTQSHSLSDHINFKVQLTVQIQ